MVGKIEKIIAHGIEVYADKEMDDLRRGRCLCLNCGEMDSCSSAKQLYGICKENDMALAVTRCKDYKEK